MVKVLADPARLAQVQPCGRCQCNFWWISVGRPVSDKVVWTPDEL